MLIALGAQPYFTAWRMLERGVLPQPGGWSEQEAHWIDAFETLEPVMRELARARRAPPEAAED